MKKFIQNLLLICFFCGPILANAQKADTKTFTGVILLQAGLPFGSAESEMKGSIGFDIRLAYHAGPGFATLTGGIAGFFGPSNSKAKSANGYYGGGIPFIKAGYKYFLDKRFFAMAEAGLSEYFLSDEVSGRTRNVRGTGLVVSPSAGVQFGKLELGLGYELFSVAGGNISNVSFRLGISF
ncbi:MAG TPA: hypothetical protein VGI82_06795 [Chitinophagaceae bacterium]|jgi:hypothetical protein